VQTFNTKAMKKIFLILLIAFISMPFCAQSQSDTIQVFKRYGGYTYTMNGKVLKIADVNELMRSNAEALPYWKKAKRATGISTVFGCVGGFCLGYTLGALMGGDFNPTLAIVGAGCLLIGIPISSGAVKNASKAIGIYNSGAKVAPPSSSYHLNVGISNDGIALVLKF
jgi:hypothetical protein